MFKSPGHKVKAFVAFLLLLIVVNLSMASCGGGSSGPRNWTPSQQYLAVFLPNGNPLLSPELLTAIAPEVVQGVFSLLNSAASAIGQESKDNAQQDQQKQAQIANDIRTHTWEPYMNYCTGQ